MLLACFQALLRQRAGKELHSQETITLFVENLGVDPRHDTSLQCERMGPRLISKLDTALYASYGPMFVDLNAAE